MSTLTDPARFTGRAPQQVDEFLNECVAPMLTAHPEALARKPVDGVNV